MTPEELRIRRQIKRKRRFIYDTIGVTEMVISVALCGYGVQNGAPGITVIAFVLLALVGIRFMKW